MSCPHIFDDEYTGPRYRYGLRNRPVASCHLPKGWIIFSDRPHPEYRCFGTIAFPHELTEDEVKSWELGFVGVETEKKP